MATPGLGADRLVATPAAAPVQERAPEPLAQCHRGVDRLGGPGARRDRFVACSDVDQLPRDWCHSVHWRLPARDGFDASGGSEFRSALRWTGIARRLSGCRGDSQRCRRQQFHGDRSLGSGIHRPRAIINDVRQRKDQRLVERRHVRRDGVGTRHAQRHQRDSYERDRATPRGLRGWVGSSRLRAHSAEGRPGRSAAP